MYFKRIEKMLNIPYHKAVDIITHKEELKQIFQEYEESWEQEKKCIVCGRPLDRILSLCESCQEDAKCMRDEYIKTMMEKENA